MNEQKPIENLELPAALSVDAAQRQAVLPNPLPTEEQMKEYTEQELHALRRNIVASCGGKFGELPDEKLECACAIHQILRSRVQGPSARKTIADGPKRRKPTKAQLKQEAAEDLLATFPNLPKKKKD